MLGHLGFSYVGLIYLLMLWIPNTLWCKNKPIDYNPTQENKVLLIFERVGQVCCTCSILIFRDFNVALFSAWTMWLIGSFLLMILYEIYWIRYFIDEHTEANFYRSICGIPVPGATLPVIAFLLLGIYGKVIWLIASSIIIGIGHIGIHIGHKRGNPMQFQGVLIRFDCTDNQQYQAIGEFWDFMSGIFPKEQLKGLGFNWMNDSFDYVIGDFEGRFDYSLPMIRQVYPASKNVAVSLPDDGWITYTGKLENIAQIYEDIYRDGVLDYEIEEFDTQGNCKISILRL